MACCGEGGGGEEEVVVRYLGVGGWLFRRGDAALLTAPLFSNPGLLRVGFWTIRSDTARVDRFLPEVRDVEAVLVGHAHYDHLLDVPYVLRGPAPRATAYGSRTMAHILAGAPGVADRRVVPVEERAGSPERAGQWTYVSEGRIRFMPLLADHSPHLLGVHLWKGEVRRDLEELPAVAWKWLEGRTLAYLIDFLDPDGTVAFRIHYADAASDPPAGFLPPLAPGDRRPVDLAILCPAAFEQVDGYPEGIVGHLRPRHAMMGHWEDFFRPRTEPLRRVPFTNLFEFLDRLEAALPPDAGWTLPEPGAEFRFRTSG